MQFSKRNISVFHIHQNLREESFPKGSPDSFLFGGLVCFFLLKTAILNGHKNSSIPPDY